MEQIPERAYCLIGCGLLRWNVGGQNAPLPINVMSDTRFQYCRFATLPKRKAAAIYWHIEISLARVGKAMQQPAAGRWLPRANESERGRIPLFVIPYRKRNMASGWSQRSFRTRAPVASTLTESRGWRGHDGTVGTWDR